MDDWKTRVPENLQAAAQEALSSAFGTAAVSAIESVMGGASGALTFRVTVNDRLYLLRIETRRSPLRNPHQYTCMRIAADAGIAPAVRYAVDAAGVAIIDFISQQPLRNYPGGPVGLAVALGQLAARLQDTDPFPVLGDYRVFVDRMLNHVGTAMFAPGLLDRHREVFEQIRAAYPWDTARHVSTHNDPNPHNILFDGQKLWLIDWETSYRNDPLTDVAVLAENHASSPDLQEVLLRAWLGREPGRSTRARLRLMRHMTRLYYATLLCLVSKPTTLIEDLAAPTADEFRKSVATGLLKPTDPETMRTLSKILLADFLARASDPEFEAALAEAQND